LLGWDRLTVIWVVGLVTALYTMKGGLRAVVYTDAIQSTVLLSGAFVLTLAGLQRVGGWHGLQSRLDPSMFSMVRPAHESRRPWLGVFRVGSFRWSMDQVLVQRVFAARDRNEGRLGTILCAFLKMRSSLPAERSERHAVLFRLIAYIAVALGLLIPRRGIGRRFHKRGATPPKVGTTERSP
jgi:Na+/proline symporter